MEIKNQQKLFLSVFFFLVGFCFSTWASRIPTIKTIFGFNEAELGAVLLSLPVSALIGLPVSGWLVARYDSRIPMIYGFTLLSVSLACIGFANATGLLVAAQFFFAFGMRMVNISMNTQALTLQKSFEKKFNGFFHGIWSTGGILGIVCSTLLVAIDVSMSTHLLVVSVVALLAAFVSYPYLLQGDCSPYGNRLALGKPDPYIIYLGLMVFFAAICEGGMYDWSGIFFREVVKEELFTIGYLVFMICMALSRFASDHVIEKIGMPKTYAISAFLILFGICLAIAVPQFWFSMIGFCLVGLGTASIFPMTFLLAGSSRKYSPGMAISIVATYALAGSFTGPPLIGYLAHAFGLRISFFAFAFAGIMLIPASQLFFRHQKALGKLEYQAAN